MKEKFLQAIEKAKKSKKRNFEQSLDLIINLKDIDLRKNSINTFVVLPFNIGKKIKICAFLNKDSKSFDLVLKKENFPKIDNKEIKKLAREYDFFISATTLMPEIAKKFGRVLGTAGKMPNPAMGSVIINENDKTLEEISKKLEKTVKIKSKEKSFKTSIGRENLGNQEMAENALSIYNSLIKILPKGKENIKSIMFKLTMGKPAMVSFSPLKKEKLQWKKREKTKEGKPKSK